MENAIGWSVTAQQSTAEVGVSFYATVTSNNQLLFDAPGSIDLALSEPDGYVGSVTFLSEDAKAAPVAYQAPARDGTGTIRALDTVQITPAVWVHDDPPITREWALMVDGVEIATSTEPQIVVPIEAIGTQPIIEERATQEDPVTEHAIAHSISASQPLGVVQAAKHLTRFIVHDGAFSVITPAPVLSSSDTSFLFVISNEPDANAGGFSRIVQGTDSGGYGISFRNNGLLQVYDDQRVLHQITGSNTVDQRGILTTALMHVEISNGDVVFNMAYKQPGSAWTSVSVTKTATAAFFDSSGENLWISSHSSVDSGKLWRVAFWPSPGAIDVTDPAFQALFVDGQDRILGVADSHAAIGIPTLDWNAQAANAATGGHDGSLGNLTVQTAPTIGNV